ncbi:MAG TPA: hypothetical protein VGG72_15210 [Bryobacteraceae bacterium]|jgi:hypothetical protein
MTASLQAVLVLLMSGAVSAQWLNYPASGIPRTPDGKPNLAAPAPRASDGKPDLSGVWNGPGPGSYDRNIARDLSVRDIQPWAEAIYQQRVRDMGKDAPRASCLPDPFAYYHMVDVARIVQIPGVIVILYQGTTNSVHRTIFTDGRPLPKDPNPTWMGYSVGHWEADTLVVETAGFNDRGWLDIEGHPHTEALHITERFHRRDFGHMDLEMTIDDPKTFTRPFSIKMPQTLTPDTDLLESVCEHDTSVPHMLGGTAIKLAPEILSKYTGTYEYAPGRDAMITFEGDLLFLQEAPNPLKLPLAPNSETEFIARAIGEHVEFLRDTQGNITGFIYHGERGDRKAVRK